MTEAPLSSSERAKHWLTTRPDWLIDLLITVAAVTTGLLSTAASSAGGFNYEPRDLTAFVLIALGTLPFLFRSRAPITVLLVAGASVIALSALGYSEGMTPAWLWVAAGTVGSRRSLRQVLACGAALLVGMVVLVATPEGALDLAGLFAQVATFSTAFAIGYSAQARRAKITALEERSQALEAEQTEAAHRAVSDERLRIAQELHDVVAHSMSVIAVQAGAGAHVIDSDPQAARRALEHIADTSRSSLAELRGMLGVLRGADGERAYAPTPGLGDLDRLVEDVRAAGVPVDLVIEGDPSDVAPGTALAAYRIVQEALTNVIKHSGPASATVRVERVPEGLDVEVCDDGRGAAAAAASNGSSGGHGLTGMRERVAIYGGTLQTGPRPSGGFRVKAHLPLGEAVR